MAKPEEVYQCQTSNCGFLYIPDRGDKRGKVPPGTKFSELAPEWKCPLCGASPRMFQPLIQPEGSG